nr:integrase, catalytic region, zinc finger, CCHC-type, peptidase aspartic, catalytic [Tanacetum cinerariifolium]
MENEHELSYETLTRVYLGSYEHYKSLGAEVEPRGDTFLFLLVLLGPTHQEQVEAILGNKGLLFVIIAKRKDTCPKNALAEVHNLDNVDTNMINQDVQKAQQLKPKLYDGNVIKKTSAIVIPDFEETLMLTAESRSKMILKQKDPMMLEKKVNTTPNSVNSPEPTLPSRPTKVEVPKELPKVSMVNMSLKKLKHHLAGFDVVVKERTTTTAITEGSLQEKVLVITALKDDLRKLKEKALANDDVTSRSIAPEMLKVDVEPLAPKLLNNRTVHSDCLRHTQKQATILREVVKQGKSQNPLNNSLHYACKYTKRIQKLLILIRQTCPNINGSSGTASVQHSKLNANSKLIYVKCNGCMLSDNHDLCVLNDVNSHDKSKSIKKNSKRKVWKPTGKVFTNIGYTWRPTGRTFTIVGNAYPLTRITTTIEVVQIILWYLDSDCSKHMTEDRSQLTNFVNKFLERRNRTLIEAARTMFIYAKALLFLWAEAVATACYTQNHSIIRLHHGKTPNELLHNKPHDLSFLYVFGALCYPTNDHKNLGKLQPKADIGIFIGYAPTKKAFRIYNRRTRRTIETIHVDFYELTVMASEHSSSGPVLHEMTLVIINSGIMPKTPPSTPFVPPSRSDWGFNLCLMNYSFLHLVLIT